MHACMGEVVMLGSWYMLGSWSLYIHMHSSCSIVLARFLQTSSTPAWTLGISVFNVSKGVRLGCESLYGGTGGLCLEFLASGRLTIWEFGNLEFWKSIYAYVCREIWDPVNSKNQNSQNQNPCRPKRPQGLDYTTYV